MGLTRSEVMSRIRGTGTKPEELLRKALWKRGLRYRKDLRINRIQPDVVLSGARVVVFVDGCFWHGCPDHYVRPRSGSDFWSRKLRENVDRDIRQSLVLRESGWRVIRVWEHEVFTDLEGVIERVRSAAASTEVEPSWRVCHVAELVDPSGVHDDFERREMVDLWCPTRSMSVDGRRTTAKW